MVKNAFRQTQNSVSSSVKNLAVGALAHIPSNIESRASLSILINMNDFNIQKLIFITFQISKWAILNFPITQQYMK